MSIERYLLDLLDWVDTQPDDIAEAVKEQVDDYFHARLRE